MTAEFGRLIEVPLLHCEPLETLTPAVSLQLVPLFGIETRPEWGVIAEAVGEMAARVTSEVPLAPITQPYTLTHAWGHEPGPQLPADTMRVYIGPSGSGDEYGSAARGGWSTSGAPLPRSWGGFIGFDLDKMHVDRVDVGTVARHEFGHVLGVGHTASGVMAPTVAPATVKTLAVADANALDAAGWDSAPASHIAGYSRVFGVGETLNGWVMVRNADVHRLFPGYVRVPDVGGWAYSPVYVSITPL